MHSRSKAKKGKKAKRPRLKPSVVVAAPVVKFDEVSVDQVKLVLEPVVVVGDANLVASLDKETLRQKIARVLKGIFIEVPATEEEAP